MSTGGARDNIYRDAPARMDDGRHFTDYRNQKMVHYIAQNTNGFRSTHEYRAYLTHHSTELRDRSVDYAQAQNGARHAAADRVERVVWAAGAALLGAPTDSQPAPFSF